ncbi:MAG: hypothetical protein M3Q64_03465 [bacterium]|nr:hypothetical protein [bacterium]
MMEHGYGFAPAPEFSPETKEMNKEQIELFAEKAKVKITAASKKSRCVDGRYSGDEDFPMISKPGGDVGDLMVAFAALKSLHIDLENEQVLAAVVDSVGGVENFQFHTDDHAEHDDAGTGMGCGHLKKATLEPGSYGLNEAQTKFIVEELPKLLAAGAHQEVLHGDHQESAVIVVDSEEYGLKPLVQTADGLQEAFVYQKTLHAQQMDVLVRNMQEKLAAAGKVVESAELIKAFGDAFESQLGATLERLALGLNVYVVSISETGEIEVTEAGTVTKKEKEKIA